MSDIQSLETVIKEAMAKQVNILTTSITNKSNLIVDLGFDGLDMVELTMNLEYNLSVEIPDEDIKKFVTVQDVIDVIVKIHSN